MRLVIRGVEVLSIPATREIELRAHTAGTNSGWQLVMLGGNAVEIQTQESNCLLGIAGCIIASEGRVTGDHAKVVRKCLLSWRVIKEVVDDNATVHGTD